MEKVSLGNSGILVSRLGFGCLCFGPLQQNLSVEESGRLMLYAMERGINMFDTAQYYKNYEHIGYALRHGGQDFVLSSKSYAYDVPGAKEALEEALTKTGKDCIDIFMLHETESEHTIRGHYDALEYYISRKTVGDVRAVGVSTHFVRAVYAAADIPEIDVIEPIINMNGIGIVDGTREDMQKAIAYAASKGKGILAMKPLGGGNLYHSAKDCFDYITGVEGINSILTGMVSKQEIDANCDYFEGRDYTHAFESLKNRNKHLLIEDWCTGCGSCVERCPNNALRIENGVSVCDREKCLTCGYCSGACKEMAIKIID
ncbi:MAG: aldo/keto reductase [Anaerofustis stercorihominis]|nr:aldo/keto reductase [Anaerofustis stercorihominis]